MGKSQCTKANNSQALETGLPRQPQWPSEGRGNEHMKEHMNHRTQSSPNGHTSESRLKNECQASEASVLRFCVDGSTELASVDPITHPSLSPLHRSVSVSRWLVFVSPVSFLSPHHLLHLPLSLCSVLNLAKMPHLPLLPRGGGGAIPEHEIGGHNLDQGCQMLPSQKLFSPLKISKIPKHFCF